MKKIVIMSDNHGQLEAIDRVKELEPDGDYFIHCGDSCAYDELFLAGFICVRGNNDWSLRDLPEYAVFKCEDLTMIITHGTYYGYFERERYMMLDLEEHNGDILICGHTHMPMIYEEDGKYLINPGSTTLPRGKANRSYAVMILDKGKVVSIEIKDFYFEDEEEEDEDSGFFFW